MIVGARSGRSSVRCKDDTGTYLQSLEADYAAAQHDGPDFSNPPKPPNADVAWEVATLCAKTIATLLDYKKTGKLPENWEPSAESQLDAADIIQKQQEKDL